MGQMQTHTCFSASHVLHPSLLTFWKSILTSVAVINAGPFVAPLLLSTSTNLTNHLLISAGFMTRWAAFMLKTSDMRQMDFCWFAHVSLLGCLSFCHHCPPLLQPALCRSQLFHLHTPAMLWKQPQCHVGLLRHLWNAAHSVSNSFCCFLAKSRLSREKALKKILFTQDSSVPWL